MSMTAEQHKTARRAISIPAAMSVIVNHQPAMHGASAVLFVQQEHIMIQRAVQHVAAALREQFQQAMVPAVVQPVMPVTLRQQAQAVVPSAVKENGQVPERELVRTVRKVRHLM